MEPDKEYNTAQVAYIQELDKADHRRREDKKAEPQEAVVADKEEQGRTQETCSNLP